MTRILDMTTPQLRAKLEALEQEYASFVAQGLSLNMARGKPADEQLELSMPMLDTLNSQSCWRSEDGTDCRNYGVLDGIPEAKRLMASMLEDEPENVIVFGSSSLTAMYDTIARCFNFGTTQGRPWREDSRVKWLCPAPGYDRHFAITEAFDFEMIPVPMTECGPDMDLIEQLVAQDSQIKGIWCVPKYSNPGGITFSEEVVRRLAAMTCAASDFRIMWDNAYCVHHLYDEPDMQDELLDIAEACIEAGNPDRYFKFASTSKITLPGAGVAAMSASPANIALIKKQIGAQAIGYDKLNQLRHVRFLKDAQGIAEHMSAHAAIIRPKFELVLEKLAAELGEEGVAAWTNPRGGYFVSFDAYKGTAKRVVSLAREAGVVMTGAGATWPYGRDPYDSNIRIAPTLPPLDELSTAMDVFCCCVKLATVEKLLSEQ